MINRFVLNEVSYFGPGAREVLPQEIKRLGLHKAFVATDKDLIKFGVAWGPAPSSKRPKRKPWPP